MTFLKFSPLSAAIMLASISPAFSAEEVKHQFTLEKVTVAATLTEQKLENVAASVVVIDAESNNNRQATNIRDMLRYEPGIEVGSQGGQGSRFGLKGFNIRGLDENRVKIMVDGINQAKAFTPAGSPYQRAGRNYIDIDSMKKIEIIKGPASTLYGSDALGGVVAFTTKDPADYLSKKGNDTAGAVKLQYNGADSALAETLTLANRTNALESLLVYTHRDADEHENYNNGYVGGTGASRTKPDPADYDSDNLLLKLQYQLNEQHRIGVTLERFESYTETNVLSKLSGNYSNYYTGKDTVTRERYGFFHHWQANNGLFDRLKWSIDQQNSDSDQNTHHVYRGASRIKAYQEDEESLTLIAQFDKKISNHHITYGINYDEIDTINVTDTLYLNTPANNTFDRYIPLVESNSLGLYIQDQITLMDGKLILTPGVRFDQFEADPKTDSRFTPAPAIAGELSKHESDKVTAHLGSVYKFTDTYSIFAQFSQGFKSPDVIDMYYGSHRNYGPGFNYLSLPNPNLESEESDSYEIGFRSNSDKGSIEIVAYYNEYTNFIDEDGLNNSYNGTTYDRVVQNININDATIKGIEFRSTLWLDTLMGAAEGTSLSLSSAYAKGTNNTDHQPIDSIAPLKTVIGLHYDSPNETWGSSLNITAVEEKETSDIVDQTDAVTDSYRIIDISGYVNLGKQVKLTMGIYNITDKEYSVWEDVRGLSDTSEHLDRHSQVGRNLAASILYSF